MKVFREPFGASVGPVWSKPQCPPPPQPGALPVRARDRGPRVPAGPPGRHGPPPLLRALFLLGSHFSSSADGPGDGGDAPALEVALMPPSLEQAGGTSQADPFRCLVHLQAGTVPPAAVAPLGPLLQ